jgi:NitT/TauT family transport system permease protein
MTALDVATVAVATPVTASRSRGRLRAALGRAARIAAGIGAVVLAWWAVIHLFDVKPYFMPGPAAVGRALVEERGTLASHALTTVIETMAGLAVATLLAVGLACVFVTSPAAERALLPLAITLRSIPIVAVAPLITLIVGRGFTTSVVCVTIVSFFPVLVNVARGLRALSSEMRELFRVTGASRLQLFRYARFHVTVPYLCAGLRSAAAVAVLGAMLAEWLTGQQGLGYLLTNAAALRDNPLLWSVVVVASSLSLAVFGLAQMLEHRLVAWARGTS